MKYRERVEALKILLDRRTLSVLASVEATEGEKVFFASMPAILDQGQFLIADHRITMSLDHSKEIEEGKGMYTSWQ